jgi:predicted hotdog family 3-hydroxylacyl-ACP dehydratase
MTWPAIDVLVPHRAPMMLLDQLLDVSETHALAMSVADVSRPLFDAVLGGWPMWVGLELMAQTVAAYAGYHDQQQGLPIRIGYLLGSRRFLAHRALLPPGVPILTRVERQYRDERMGSFECRVSIAEQCCAEAIVNTYQP